MLQWGIRLGWRSADRPRTTLVLMLALVLAATPGLFRLRLATDGHSLVPPDDPAIAVDRAALYHRVAAATRPYATAGERISVVGAPAAEALLGESILRDLALLVPLALAVIAAVLWASCGRTWAVVVGLAKLAAAEVFTLGLIGWSGQPVYLTTAILPVLLTTVGLSDEIHLLWCYRHRPPGEEPALALRRALLEVGRPIIRTSL